MLKATELVNRFVRNHQIVPYDNEQKDCVTQIIIEYIDKNGDSDELSMVRYVNQNLFMYIEKYNYLIYLIQNNWKKLRTIEYINLIIGNNITFHDVSTILNTYSVTLDFLVNHIRKYCDSHL